jgi:CubicO group peptidase (beta-lactamase class C family)
MEDQKMIGRYRNIFIALFTSLFFVIPTVSQNSLPADVAQKVDTVAADSLKATGVPAASVAIVKNGQIVYVKAYGNAKLEPPTPATPEMRFSIGSISKQFTAAAILMLQEEGKLSLDDKVSKFLPDLTRANEVTIRQLLSHTSGYQDYWPQDYVMPGMLQPVTAQKILDQWARIPLDFDPGTKWQYSNTNYVIAGLIAEKAAGMPLVDYLRKKVFVPLDMKSVTDIDKTRLTQSDPTGYLRYALGPLRPAPKEGPGWLFAAGELAMTAQDLAKWDISVMDQKLMKPSSYNLLETETVLKNGVGTQYGLGVSVRSSSGRRMIEHSGEVSGFTAENMIFPDERVAVVVLTNQDAAGGAGAIASGVVPLLFSTTDAETPAKTAQAKAIFEGLQQGKIDRSLFTSNANFYFSDQALQDFAAGLGPLGPIQSFTQVNKSLRGGMTLRVYSVRFANKNLRAWTFEMLDGKLEQFQVAEQ